MDRPKRIFLFFATLAIIILIAGFMTLGSSIGSSIGSSTTAKYKVSCDGIIDVPASSAIGNPKIKTNSCQIQECGRFTLSIFSDPFAQEGNIQLIINNQVQDSSSWSSSFGADQQYELQSSCIPRPSSATVKVRDTDGNTHEATEEFT